MHAGDGQRTGTDRGNHGGRNGPVGEPRRPGHGRNAGDPDGDDVPDAHRGKLGVVLRRLHGAGQHVRGDVRTDSRKGQPDGDPGHRQPQLHGDVERHTDSRSRSQYVELDFLLGRHGQAGGHHTAGQYHGQRRDNGGLRGRGNRRAGPVGPMASVDGRRRELVDKCPGPTRRCWCSRRCPVPTTATSTARSSPTAPGWPRPRRPS